MDAQFERFGEWLKHKTGSDGDNQFVNGFVTTSLTVSIGAMAVIGSIQDGIYGDAAKALLLSSRCGVLAVNGDDGYFICSKNTSQMLTHPA